MVARSYANYQLLICVSRHTTSSLHWDVRLTMELISPEQVCLCIEDTQEDFAIDITNAGPDMVRQLEKLIMKFSKSKFKQWRRDATR